MAELPKIIQQGTDKTRIWIYVSGMPCLEARPCNGAWCVIVVNKYFVAWMTPRRTLFTTWWKFSRIGREEVKKKETQGQSFGWLESGYWGKNIHSFCSTSGWFYQVVIITHTARQYLLDTLKLMSLKTGKWQQQQQKGMLIIIRTICWF